MFERHAGWRHINVTEHRTATDFAEQMRELVDHHYPDAQKIRVVLDNLNTHRPSALYERFDPAEARRILRKLEFHFTPKHASWLNMVEIEIGVLSKQCLDRRIPSIEELSREVAAWVADRNERGSTINWLFDVDAARRKMGRSYPKQETDVEVRKAA
jgi:transposase